jgi:hypothetical protein
MGGRYKPTQPRDVEQNMSKKPREVLVEDICGVEGMGQQGSKAIRLQPNESTKLARQGITEMKVAD